MSRESDAEGESQEERDREGRASVPMDRQVAPVLSLAKYLRNWRLPGVNTIISLLTFLGFVLSNWQEIPGE